MIETATVQVVDITEKQVHDMFAMMQEYYENVGREDFLKDLGEKRWIILLRDSEDLCGFSTLKTFHHAYGDKVVRVAFSGDTVIRREFWHSFALPVAWGRLMLSILEEDPEKELHWLLTAKGYRTYRFLPVFFRQFYPSCLQEGAERMKDLLISIAQEAFGPRFNKKRMILKARPGSQRLKQGVGDINEVKRKNMHIRFFEKSNPGHVQGDELVCIARFHENNE